MKGSVPSAAAADATPWSEFARAAIEANLSAGDTLREQRQQSRRLLAILRFLRYLIESANEAELMQALVQAAAVWFDVDARVYRRDLSGDFVLQNWLPGVEPDQASRRLDVQVIGVDREVKRLAPSHELGGLASLGGETLVVPLAGLSRTDLVMTLSGAAYQSKPIPFSRLLDRWWEHTSTASGRGGSTRPAVVTKVSSASRVWLRSASPCKSSPS